MFEKILVMGRGEVAARIARTCRRIGAETVALASDSEVDAIHVSACDEHVSVGPDAVAESYANIAGIVQAALMTQCQAIHPGYGLLEADPMLRRACDAAGVVLIGPSADELVLLRDRVLLREAAADSGIRVLEGSERVCRDADELRQDAASLGYPLVVKPAFGIGEAVGELVVLQDDEGLEAFVSSADWDAHAYYLERWVDRPRHVEVQVASDGRGQVVVLGDREVSVRKDHRRLVSESPAPAIDELRHGEAVRAAVGAAATDFCLLLGWRGIGSVHFVFDDANRFYFVGFRPLLCPEHALVEMTSGVDLVEAQVRLAAGEEMPVEILRAQTTGHAVQARVEAALDPRTGQPFAARVEEVRWPPAPTGKVRIECGVQKGSRVAPDHTPLVASITTFAATRHEAVLMLDRIVAETRIAPVTTNLRLIRKALNHESFRACQYDEGFLDRLEQRPA